MKAKDFVIDFFNYIFLLILVVFCIIYFIVGDRLFAFTEFMKSLLPLAYFSIIFLVVFKFKKKSMDEMKREDTLNEIVAYLSKMDKIKDITVISILTILILAIAYIFDGQIGIIDIFQAFFGFSFIFGWHLVLFRKKDSVSKLMYITNFEENLDAIAIFVLPVIIIAVPLFFKNVDPITDSIQAAVPLIIMYGWRKIMLLNK